MLIHSMQYFSLWIDEVHQYRNNVSSLIGLAQSAALVTALTATPLFTGHGDLLSIGHILSLPTLCTPSAMEKKKHHDKLIQRAKTAVRKEEAAIQDAVGKPSTSGKTSAAGALGHAQLDAVHWIAEQFDDYILRRTGDSVDDEGNPLIGLSPYESLMFTVTLSPIEMKALNKVHSENRGGTKCM
jgi:hypothetical protein